MSAKRNNYTATIRLTVTMQVPVKAGDLKEALQFSEMAEPGKILAPVSASAVIISGEVQEVGSIVLLED